MQLKYAVSLESSSGPLWLQQCFKMFQPRFNHVSKPYNKSVEKFKTISTIINKPLWKDEILIAYLGMAE